MNLGRAADFSFRLTLSNRTAISHLIRTNALALTKGKKGDAMSQTTNTSFASVEDRQDNGPVLQQANDAQPRVLREPPTGKEFLEKLRDGRVIYFDGELVKDVTTHPAFATSARSYARMYDTLHDPAKHGPVDFRHRAWCSLA